MKRTISAKCLVCGGQSLEILAHMFSKYCPKFFHKVVICQDCGHIQIYPFFDEKEYAAVNEKFFNQKYLISSNENPDNLKKKKKLDERLSSYLKEGFKVLDVGPGEAWAMDYFQERKCNYFAIEAVDRLALSISKRGGTVIGKSIFDSYPNHENYFDIVVFRHVLEHMVNPYQVLVRLKYFLNSNGLIYLAVPNASNISIKKGFRTSWLRPVHVSYFCEGNVLRIAESAGLRSIRAQSSGEIYCLLKHGCKRQLREENFYHQQKTVFLKMKHRAFFKDIYNMGRIITKKLF
jgi:2-polyprenyl-3-methyl-5-hydroxy-6-metoxy-1,4-benzoquinol methylase